MEFEQIYSTYFKAVYLYVLQLTGDVHTAEEITSETFFKAINTVDRFRGDCDMRVWLCQIAKNTYYSHLKKNGHELHPEDAVLQNIPDPQVPMEAHFIDRDDARQMYGKSDNWACVTYHRARKMIQSRLEEIEHEK